MAVKASRRVRFIPTSLSPDEEKKSERPGGFSGPTKQGAAAGDGKKGSLFMTVETDHEETFSIASLQLAPAAHTTPQPVTAIEGCDLFTINAPCFLQAG
jgi:hypothetical protein